MRIYGVSLGEGNMKVGDVFTFSLPSKTTCPGASPWCLKHCYAYRYEQFRPGCQKAYGENLALTQNPQEFVRTMVGVLPRIMSAFRIHVSGDFYSTSYVEAWTEICRAFPQTLFWGYTRSWAIPELQDALQGLRALPNVQFFASIDPDMPLPPREWRRAFVLDDPRAMGMLCAFQTEEQKQCLVCGYCLRRRHGDVIFKVH